MDSSRRGFFRNLVIGGASTVLGIEATAEETPLELPIKNPFFTTKCDSESICKGLVYTEGHKTEFSLENEFIKLTLGDSRYMYSIEPKVPMTLQDLYSALKWEWSKNPDLIRYSFPMVAITPEQFEAVDNWSIETDNLRQGGLRQVDRWTFKNPIMEYAGVCVLTQEGKVFNSNKKEMPNGSLLPLGNDGRIQGWYKKYDSEILVDLHEHMENTIGVSDSITYQYYRIA